MTGKRTRSITVRLTEEEYKTVKKISKAFKQTMAGHMRQVVLTFAPRWPAGIGKRMIDQVKDDEEQ